MVFILVIFVVTMAVSIGAYWLVQRSFTNRDKSALKARLGGKAAGAKQAGPSSVNLIQGDKQERKKILDWILAKINIDRALQNLLEQSGATWAPGQVCIACLALAFVAFNAVWYLSPFGRVFAFAAAPAAGALPILYLRRKRRKRMDAFEGQFPDSLQFVARAMRAGHAFSVSLEMLHKEFAEPLAGEFRRVFEEQNLGLPIDIALEKLATRMPFMDVQFFVAAVLLQKRTGGNLAEILDNLAVLIRERFKLRGQIRTISAHGRMSSAVLTAIPTVVSIMMWFVNNDHMMFFVNDEMGQWMAGLAVGFQALGYLIMRQIVKIEV